MLHSHWPQTFINSRKGWITYVPIKASLPIWALHVSSSCFSQCCSWGRAWKAPQAISLLWIFLSVTLPAPLRESNTLHYNTSCWLVQKSYFTIDDFIPHLHQLFDQNHSYFIAWAELTIVEDLYFFKCNEESLLFPTKVLASSSSAPIFILWIRLDFHGLSWLAWTIEFS